MKFAQSFKILTSTAPGAYARALRAIGQDLADLFPSSVEIQVYGEKFVVRGECAKERLAAKQSKPQRQGFKDFCADMLARDVATLAGQAKTVTIRFERSYSAEDINHLDEIGMRRRFGVGKIPDIRSLAETLRTIGRLVDGQSGQLMKIHKDARRIVFEYSDGAGKSHNEMMTIPDLYKLQKSFYQKRGAPVGLDPWQNRK
jgi:hypothetical protein